MFEGLDGVVTGVVTIFMLLCCVAMLVALAVVAVHQLEGPELGGLYRRNYSYNFLRQIEAINADPSFEAISEKHHVIHHDEFGWLYYVSIPETQGVGGGRKYWRAYVGVQDGQGWHYIAVPVSCKTAKEAVAWTYNMTADEYAPEIRT